MHKLTMTLDDDDFRAINEEVTRRQVQAHKVLNMPTTAYLPEGESCLVGAIIAESIRALEDYRAIWEAEHPPISGGPDDETE